VSVCLSVSLCLPVCHVRVLAGNSKTHPRIFPHSTVAPDHDASFSMANFSRSPINGGVVQMRYETSNLAIANRTRSASYRTRERNTYSEHILSVRSNGGIFLPSRPVTPSLTRLLYRSSCMVYRMLPFLMTLNDS